MALQGIYPVQGTGGQDYQQLNAQYLCLDLILAFVGRMTMRAEGVGTTAPLIEGTTDTPLCRRRANRGLLYVCSAVKSVNL